MKPTDQKIYLASKSPRRRELLRQIGVDFELMLLRDLSPRGPDVTEAPLPDEPAHLYVARVTQEKAAFASKLLALRRQPPRPVLAADTTVVLDGRIMGKPGDRAEATAMLTALSGRTHAVLTSVVVQRQEYICQATNVSEVTFATLAAKEIDAYCMTPEPYDKAGAYGIQGLASIFIERIAGSHSGIMGLPLFETAQLLRQAGIHLP